MLFQDSLSRRKRRWSLYFSRLNLIFCFCSVACNGKADALSRLLDFHESRPQTSSRPMFHHETFPENQEPGSAQVHNPVPLSVQFPAPDFVSALTSRSCSSSRPRSILGSRTGSFSLPLQ